MGRTQQVQFGNTKSEKRAIKFGVPQGSKLGPWLFILYMNEIVKIAKSNGCDCKLFADDKILYFKSKNVERIEELIHKTLENLVYWLDSNSLKVNTKKTVYMIVHDKRKKLSNESAIQISGESIERIKETKYLGVFSDEN